jgi:hypothetical protein
MGDSRFRRDGQPMRIGNGQRQLDLLLELLERRELRILLAVAGGELSLGRLAEALDKPTRLVRRAAWRLYLAGMLRQRHDSATQGPAFAITIRGLAALKPLVTAATPRAAAAS